TRSVETSQTGSYRVFPLMPGRYEVSAAAAGFKRKIQPSVVLDIASTVKVDFQLDVGQMTESVEVTASATVLQTQDASVGGTVTSTELEHMTVTARNYTPLTLILLSVSDRRGLHN